MKKNGVKSHQKMKRMVVNCLRLRLHRQEMHREFYHQICPENVVVLEVAHLDYTGRHCQVAVVVVCQRVSRLPQVGVVS